MAGRGRFKVPSAKELDDITTNVKPKSLFESYKNNKTKPQETSAGDSAGKKPSSSCSNPIASTATSVSQPLSKNIQLPSTSSASATSDSGSKGTERAPIVSSSTNEQTGPPASTSKQTSSNSIIVSYRQRGNPILKHIRNVTWEYGSIVPDYVMGKANCALFLSLRYHQMNPQYLHNRLKELGRGYDLRVLLVQVDVKDPHHLLKDLAKICILADCTLMLAFSAEEAGRYLEAYKVYENKPAEALMEKTDTDYISKVTECLTTVKSVNKTDCLTLASNFKSMEGIINTDKEDLSMCAGFGPQKAARLHNVFHEPFLKIRKRQKHPGSDNSSSPVKKPS